MMEEDNPQILKDLFRKNRKLVLWQLGTLHCILKSSQSKDYGIGHKKNFNKLLKSVVKAKKHTEIGCMP